MSKLSAKLQEAAAPASIEELRERGFSLHERGDLESAEPLYRTILDQVPDDLEVKYALGVLAVQSGRYDLAAELLAAVNESAETAAARGYLGDAWFGLSRHAEALASYERALQLDDHYAPAHLNRAELLKRAGRRGEALAGYRRAITLRPNFVEPHLGLAELLYEMKDFEASLASVDTALELGIESAAAFTVRGLSLRGLGRPAEAIASFDRAIVIDPAYAPAHINRGAALRDSRRPEEALQCYERVVGLASYEFEALNNRGTALLDLGRCEEAVAAFDRALALRPDRTEVHINRATGLIGLARFDEALAAYDGVIDRDPHSAEARFEKGVCLLLLGRMEAGWPLYEWRKRREQALGVRALPQPLWDGRESLRGRSLLIHTEQGLGDTIQFARYARLADQWGARVTFQVQAPLCRLLATLGPSIQVVPEGRRVVETDLQCALLSFPAVCGTTPDTIPADTPYLQAEPDRVNHWRRRLGPDGFKVGIHWQGHTGRADIGRSFPLRYFQPISALTGVRLVSLQKGHGSEQLQSMPQGMRVETLGDAFDAGHDAFLDTAAVLECLDLVITSDTAVAHLAGALGRPVWVVLKKVPDWRWMLERDDTPWYPQARLFRQRVAGSWSEVFSDIRQALTLYLG